jgi:drug/metabolite transporter (DMT)-like permease
MILTYVAFVFLGLIWGSNFIYMKWAAALISPEQIVLLRVFFGFLPLAFAAWHKGVINRSQARHLPHFLVMSAQTMPPARLFVLMPLRLLNQSSAFCDFSSMNATAINPSKPQPITYQAGASVLPVATISEVTKNCAKPPKIATPRL